MYRAYKYQLFPTAEQKMLLDKNIGCVRWIYNWALNIKNTSHEKTGRSLSRFDIQGLLPELKKQQKTVWLKEACSQSLQCSIFNLENAFKKFFKEKKGYPSFKSKRDTRQSVTFPTGTYINWDNSTIKIPKVKGIAFSYSRKFNGLIKSATVTKSPTGKYYISLVVDNVHELPTKSEPKLSNSIGIDLGIKDFATLSNGEKIANPRHYRKEMLALARLQRRLSRKQKASKNREKQRIEVANKHERITNLRKDFLHKLSTRLVRENQTICMEDLNVKGLLKNRKLSLSISDAGWGMFKQMIAYKCDWYGKNLLTIGRFEPSSKTCSCGVVNKDLKLKDRLWTCGACNTTHDRDILAAQNIVKFAFNKLIAEGTPQINAFGDATIVASMN